MIDPVGDEAVAHGDRQIRCGRRPSSTSSIRTTSHSRAPRTAFPSDTPLFPTVLPARPSPGTTATSRTRSPTRGLGMVGPGVAARTASTRRPGPITSTSGRRSTRSSAYRTPTRTTAVLITQLLGNGERRTTRRSRTVATRRPVDAARRRLQAAERAVRLVRRSTRSSRRPRRSSRRDELKYDSIETQIANLTAKRERARGNDPRSAQR